MELRVGYKNTDVGVIPNDWDVKTYGDVFDYLVTATYSRAELTEVDNIRYIHYGDIHTKWNFFLDILKSNLPTVRNEQVKNYPLLKEGDVVMADASEDYSGIGKSVEVKNLKDVKAISGLHTFLLRDKKEVFVNGFRGYIHSNKIVKTQFDRLATGLKVYGVSKGNLKSVKIPVPTKPEQTAIANALSDADALISSLENLIAKKRNVKQGVMQKLLQPKEGWQVKTIEEMCVQNGLVRGPFGGALKKEYFVKSGIKVYEQKNAIYRNENLGDYYIDNTKFSELSRFELKPRDFIVSCSGTIGKIFQIPTNSEKGIINQALLKITIDSAKYSESYFYHYFSWEKFQEKIIDSTQGGAMKNLVGMPIFKTTKIPIPISKEEQTDIAIILSDMDSEIEALETKLEKYRNVKLGMMQTLLTGKIRLV